MAVGLALPLSHCARRRWPPRRPGGALVLPTGVARAWPSAWPSHCPTAHAVDGRLGDREDCLQPRCGMEDRGRRRSRANDAALDSHPCRSAGPEAMAIY
ncbi:hypothetical protein TRIUR3_21217 [Triticum urartu]|uniref:Uncharacterized protein n=1 Tax=Triticum urartu TaxID=4572 RepID=M7YRK1_TRIUA|nr:hypothetical protein TRIUR3_21217 [Triticum urartu]